ncbi:hypothetical protein AGMMS5026_10820 [Endomicrobiia bacterium]|nr:hypothetical protein AGMMS49532_10270 [Endomicrobiia bacterium]GHT14746.1 hypothetical protein AGMMS49571_10970 [Endomicrobiia bacterium]GHT21752.1 hypothetical protein AGMMS49929_10670 [Endomicrobiia bacterium]GHT25174.1 hypothetical protein AGMMS49953_09480 [Endomicrobiia bacterium]GHT32592.1 hypothetical protein AGMMS5026_10820 [Endomicrobiia bacterium]
MLSLKDNKKSFFSLMCLFFLVVCGCHSAKEFRDGYITGLADGYALSVNEFKYNAELAKIKDEFDWSKVDFKSEMKMYLDENKYIEKKVYDDYVKNGRKV